MGFHHIRVRIYKGVAAIYHPHFCFDILDEVLFLFQLFWAITQHVDRAYALKSSINSNREMITSTICTDVYFKLPPNFL